MLSAPPDLEPAPPMRILHLAVICVVAPFLAIGPSARAEDAGCEEATTTADVDLALDNAEAAFAELDVDKFRGQTDAARSLLPCVSDPFPRHMAARWHRFQGLRAFVDRDPELASRSFAAARSVEPQYRFPESIVPTGHPVLREYEAIDVAQGSWLDVPAPAAGRLEFDGRSGLQRPGSWPTILQIFDDAGSVVSTTYLRRDDPLPTYAIALAVVEAPPDPVTPDPDPGEVTPDPLPTQPLKRKRWRIPLAMMAGGTAVAAAGLYGVAAGLEGYYKNPDNGQSIQQLADTRRATNGLVVTSAVLGVAAVSAGAIVVFAAKW